MVPLPVRTVRTTRLSSGHRIRMNSPAVLTCKRGRPMHTGEWSADRTNSIAHNEGYLHITYMHGHSQKLEALRRPKRAAQYMLHKVSASTLRRNTTHRTELSNFRRIILGHSGVGIAGGRRSGRSKSGGGHRGFYFWALGCAAAPPGVLACGVRRVC